MVEKSIRGGMCRAIYRYEKANNNLKDFNRSKRSSYLMYFDVKNLYGWEMSQKLPLDGFEWRKTMNNSCKTMIKTVTKDTYSKLMLII